MEQLNQIELREIVKLSGYTFEIGGYQRGYKWGKKEIIELLEDIHEFDDSKGIYCLQPLILAERSDYYEIIDGQQRTTTIYLMLHFFRKNGWLKGNVEFKLRFEIRERSKDFLSHQKTSLDELFDFLPENSNEKLSEKNFQNMTSCNEHWNNYVTKYPNHDNVDIYHFFTVAYYLKLWSFNYLDDDKREIFIKKFLNDTHIVWYNMGKSEADNSVINTFLNNNKGKITLTSSELIKALFVLDIAERESKEIAGFKINRFAQEWDLIEKKLQDDSFWLFIQADTKKYNKGTRIDFLFDTYFKRDAKKDDSFAYRKVEDIINHNNSGQLETIWAEVMNLFDKLVDYYNNKYFYHFIGFLTVSKLRTLLQILDLSKGVSKDKFLELLKKEIKDIFWKKNKNSAFYYNIDELHYEKSYNEVLKVLLLHNVLYYIDNISDNRFPFDLYLKEKWSIEHIVPQNPPPFVDLQMYKDWFRDQLELNGIGKSDQREREVTLITVAKLDEIRDEKEFENEKELQKELELIAESFRKTTHFISNLVLVDRNTNSALGNNLFMDKRIKILQFDREGKTEIGKKTFIPMETLNAFNKTFSDEKDLNMKMWTHKDGQQYKNALYERLMDFLPIRENNEN